MSDLNLKCISTGSNGNCYILSYGNKQLILDLGVKYQTLLSNLVDVSNIKGVLLTHEHGDHNYKGAKHKNSELLSSITTVISPSTHLTGVTYVLDCFKVIAVKHKHNVDCYGYLIKIDNDIIYFATDMQFPIQFDNLKINHFIVECNYINRIREENIIKVDSDTVHLGGVYQNHCSLETLIDYFSKLNYKPKNILTIHSSNSNLFSRKEVEDGLNKFAEKMEVVFNSKTYNLK